MIEVRITGNCKNLDEAVKTFILMVEKEKGTITSASENRTTMKDFHQNYNTKGADYE